MMPTLLPRLRRGRPSTATLAPSRRMRALFVAGLFLLAVPWRPGAPWAPWTPSLARAEAPATRASDGSDFGKLLDAVVEKTAKHFWDKERLAEIGWEKRAGEVRQSVADAPDLAEAARRINALLGELKASHTALLTPDDVEYYILLAVFAGADMPQQERDEKFWGAGVTYAGIGHFSVRITDRDYVDAVMEGSPAERAGLKVGDEIVAVD